MSSLILPLAKKEEDEEINFFMLKREELLEVIKNDPDFPKAFNYRFTIALPILEEKTKGGLILSGETMEVAYHGNNIGRIMSIGGTVGGYNGGHFQDCKGLKVGDYVQYNPHAGLPSYYHGSRFITVSDEAIFQQLFNPAKHSDGIFKRHSIRGLD